MPERLGSPREGKGRKDNNDVQGERKSWYDQYEKYIRKTALIIAIFLLYLVLSKADQTYTNLGTDKNSMLMLYLVAVLVSYYIGGTPTILKTTAIIGVVLCFMPVFFQTTPQHITREVISFVRPVTPPRDLEWMSREIKPTSERIVRVYNGDKFVYKAPLGFWIVEEGGPKHFHNPSLQPGEVRSFNFYDLPVEGREIKIQTGEEKTPFWMDFKITKG